MFPAVDRKTMRLLPPNHPQGWTPLVWLVYSAGYVGYPFLFGASRLEWLVWAAGLGVFLAMYFRAHWLEGSERVPFIIGLAVLGAVLAPLNPGAVVFFIYAAAFVGGTRSGRTAAAWIAVITVAGVAATWFAAGGYRYMALNVAVFAPLIGFVNVHYAESRRRDATLALAQDEIARLGALAERDRIAADLHDLLGHTLSVIVLKAELAAKLLSRDPARAAAEIGEVERISRDTLSEVRRAVHGFRTATLADELVRARGVLSSAGVHLTTHALVVPAEGRVPGLAARTEHALALVLREATTNIVRHARAFTCRIDVGRLGDRLRLEIVDDGVGGGGTEGAGISGMRARLQEIGGALEWMGERGVTVRATAPWLPDTVQDGRHA